MTFDLRKEYKAVREIHSKAETNIERKHVYALPSELNGLKLEMGRLI